MLRPDFTAIKALFDQGGTFTIFLPTTPSYDAVASALSLKLSLESAGKRVTVISFDPMTVEFNRLVGVDTINNSVGGNNLVISFHDQSELVDTVSYDLDKGELRLVINTKPNAPAQIDHRRLKFIPGTPKADIVITIGVNHPSELKEPLPSSKVVAITHSAPVTSFATHHLSHPESSSLSELITQLIDTLGFQLHEDVATNLYLGLSVATDNFQSGQVSQATFETAALLLRRGARRDRAISATDFPQGSIPQAVPQQPITGYGTDHKQEDEPEVTTDAKPADWYEPKIYRGPMLQ